MRFGKLFLLTSLLLLFLSSSFGFVCASEDVTYDIVSVSDDVYADEVVSEVDSSDESIATSNDMDIESVDEFGNESLAVQDEEPVNDIMDVDSALSDENDNNHLLKDDSLDLVRANSVKKTASFVGTAINIDMYDFGYINHNFYYDKPLRLGLKLAVEDNGIPTGNITAVVNGNSFQGTIGDYYCSSNSPKNAGYKYNCYFEITNFTLGDNLIEFFYSGDANYKSCYKSISLTSVISQYNNLCYDESKKKPYFDGIWYLDTANSQDYTYIQFIYGKPLRIAVNLMLRGTDENPKGNLTAVVNGNVYQGIPGDYYDNNVRNRKYNYLFEITNYTLGKNIIEFVYLGDDEYNSCSQLIDFNSFIDDYEFSWAQGLHSGGGGYFGENLFKCFNLYDATGNLTIISNGISTSYNLSGERITHEFNDYSTIVESYFIMFKMSNYTLVYSGDETYNGFSTVFDDLYAVLDLFYSEYSGDTYYVGEIPEINLYLGNATGNVSFIVNNNRYSVNIVNGVAYAEITNYTLGYNKVDIEYSGDGNYPSFSKKDDFNYYGFMMSVLPMYDLEVHTCLVQNEYANCIVVQISNELGLIGNCTVNLCIDGKNVNLNLINGVGIYNISQDLVNYIKVDYAGDNKYYPVSSSDFIRWNGDYIVNKDNYMFYFNQADGGKLFYWIPDGVTLDIQGSIISPGTYFNITKPLNIISSTHDAFIDFNTTAGSLLGEAPGARFAISHGGSGTNVTGIYIHNTQVWLENVSHVVLDNISVVVENQRVGSGVGVTSIRSNSSYVTVKNSYFYTSNNGGSSTLVGAWANYCTIDNNTFRVEGMVGNIIYFTFFNVYIPKGELYNHHVNITNNKIYGPSVESSICEGIVGEGTGFVENNTIIMAGAGIDGIPGRCINNVLMGGCDMHVSGVVSNNYVSGSLESSDSIVYNNTVIGDAIINGGTIFNNTFKGDLTVKSCESIINSTTFRGSSILFNNFINGLLINGACVLQNNTINGNIKFVMQYYFNLSGTQINNNLINGDFVWNRGLFKEYIPLDNISIINNVIHGSINSLKSNSGIIINNTIISSDDYAIDLTDCSNNVVKGNVIRAKLVYGNGAIKNSNDNNVIIDNCPVNPNLNVSADNIYVGDPLQVFTVIDENVSGNVEVIVNGKVYTIKSTNGSVSVEDLPAGCFVVTARYMGDDYFGLAEKSIIVNVSKFSPVLEITLGDAAIGEDVLVSINIFGASGNVNLIVDGEENILTLNNDVATYNIKNIGAGSHSIVAIYNGDERNEATYSSKNIILKEIFTKITDITIDGDLNIHATLKDDEGNPIYNATINYVTNSQKGTVTTDLNGAFTIQGQKNSKVEITYTGTNVFRSISTSVTLDNIIPFKIACQFDANKLTCYAVDTAAGEKGVLYKVVLKDASGNLITNAEVQFVLNGVIYNTKTNVNGIASIQVNINKANTYTCTIKYFGDSKHEGTVISSKIIVNKKTTTLTAKAGTFKVKTKTKKYSATLKTVKGSSADGKTYLKSGKKVILKVGGKIYTAKINKNGKVTFKITKLNKKGKYTAVIKFAGDNTYKAVTKKVKITVK